MSSLTGNKVKPSNNNAVCDHLFLSNYLLSFDKFKIFGS